MHADADNTRPRHPFRSDQIPQGICTATRRMSSRPQPIKRRFQLAFMGLLAPFGRFGQAHNSRPAAFVSAHLQGSFVRCASACLCPPPAAAGSAPCMGTVTQITDLDSSAAFHFARRRNFTAEQFHTRSAFHCRSEALPSERLLSRRVRHVQIGAEGQAVALFVRAVDDEAVAHDILHGQAAAQLPQIPVVSAQILSAGQD